MDGWMDEIVAGAAGDGDKLSPGDIFSPVWTSHNGVSTCGALQQLLLVRCSVTSRMSSHVEMAVALTTDRNVTEHPTAWTDPTSSTAVGLYLPALCMVNYA